MLLMPLYVCKILVCIGHQLFKFSLIVLQLGHFTHHYSSFIEVHSTQDQTRVCVGPCTTEIDQLPLWPVPHAISNLLVFLFQSGITHFLKEVAMMNNGLPNLVTKHYSKQVLHKSRIVLFMRAAKVNNSINTRSFYNMNIP